MTTAVKAAEVLEMSDKYGAHNYHPLPIVISKAEGIWVEDPEGNRYIDMLSAYSALNHGHRHPKIIDALKAQADKVTLTSRAFENEQLGPWLKELCALTGYEKALPMNSGAEAVETAVKTARKWGYKVKGVEADKAEIIVCSDNFHGRTVTICAMSTEEQYRDGFGPFTPGFVIIKYGDAAALQKAISKNTVAFIVEPIQGEAGIVMPKEGFLKEAAEICKKNNVLFICDEIQTGFGRTGKLFCWEHENARPDMVIMGKALGGGVMPISAVASSKEILGVFNPGDHGSTFGGNPLACAVSRAALKTLVDENLVEKSAELGAYFLKQLKNIKCTHIKEIRGRGLFIGLELHPEAQGARRFCEALMKKGLLCKETHANVIRFAPPLIITKKELDSAIEKISEVLTTL